MNAQMIPRGLRLHNPGNLRNSSTRYVGEIVSPDPDFKAFVDDAHGLRAIIEILRAYQAHDYIRTVRGAITRYSPPVDDNPTSAYVDHVCEACQIGPDDPVLFNSILRPLVRAIVTQEQGYWPYNDAMLELAIALAEDE